MSATPLPLNDGWTPDEPIVVVTKSLAERALAEGYDLGDAIRTALTMMALNGQQVALLGISEVAP